MGGSFDPVHKGHIYLANQAITEVGLEKLVMVPVGKQPFKQERAMVAGHHRFNMLSIATKAIDNIYIWDYELKKSGISYTINTLKAAEKHFAPEGDCEFYFLVGTDAFLKIEIWKQSEALLRDFGIIVGKRPGYREEELKLVSERIEEKYGTEIVEIQNRELEISSTEIRTLLKSDAHEDLSPYLYPEVERYIKENGLYKG